MKIVIISDIHDNLPNLKKCLAWCAENKIEKIICAGDVTNSETLQTLSENFSGEIFLIRGNGEIFSEEEIAIYKNITYGGCFAIFEIGGKNVGVCHEPFFKKEFLGVNSSLKTCQSAGRGSVDAPRVRPASNEAEGGVPVDIIFCGHTHKPWIEIKNGIQIINPGTLGGVFTPATFAVWDTDKREPELKLLASL